MCGQSVKWCSTLDCPELHEARGGNNQNLEKWVTACVWDHLG